MAVNQLLKETRLKAKSVLLGEVELSENLSNEQMQELAVELSKLGFE